MLIILIYFFYLLIFVFLTFIVSFFVYFLILLLLQRNDPTPQTSFAFAVITDEWGFMPPPVLALFDPAVIFSADV